MKSSFFLAFAVFSLFAIPALVRATDSDTEWKQPVSQAERDHRQREKARLAAESKRLSEELERQVREKLRHRLDQKRPAETKRLADEEQRIAREKARHEKELLRQRREAGVPDPTPEVKKPERTPDPGGHTFRFHILRLEMGASTLVLELKCVGDKPCVFCRKDTPTVCITRQLSISLDNRAAGTAAHPPAPFVQPSA